MTNKTKIHYSKKFNKSIEKLDKKTRIQVETAIFNFLTTPKAADVKKLRGYNDLYRLRSGNYRIIFKEIEETILIIIFLDVKHRKDVYRDL